MDALDVEQLYFDWLYRIVCGGDYSRGLSWHKLIRKLYVREFVYALDMDANREDDGIDLRYRFAYEMGDEKLADYLENDPCSILEMMVALSFRCEEQIMGDPEDEHPDRWFFEMIENLGIDDMDDDHYDDGVVDHILDIFINREYQDNGQGGLFWIRDTNGRDLRYVEIWYQLMWYLEATEYQDRRE